jgi:hypothetical protein
MTQHTQSIHTQSTRTAHAPHTHPHSAHDTRTRAHTPTVPQTHLARPRCTAAAAWSPPRHPLGPLDPGPPGHRGPRALAHHRAPPRAPHPRLRTPGHRAWKWPHPPTQGGHPGGPGGGRAPPGRDPAGRGTVQRTRGATALGHQRRGLGACGRPQRTRGGGPLGQAPPHPGPLARCPHCCCRPALVPGTRGGPTGTPGGRWAWARWRGHGVHYQGTRPLRGVPVRGCLPWGPTWLGADQGCPPPGPRPRPGVAAGRVWRATGGRGESETGAWALGTRAANTYSHTHTHTHSGRTLHASTRTHAHEQNTHVNTGWGRPRRRHGRGWGGLGGGVSVSKTQSQCKISHAPQDLSKGAPRWPTALLLPHPPPPRTQHQPKHDPMRVHN